MLHILNTEIVPSFYEPVRFWPYATTVADPILVMPYKSGDMVDKLAIELMKMFNNADITSVSRAALDNKIAFEVKDIKGRTFFLGFKDWVFTLGTDINSDHKPRQRI